MGRFRHDRLLDARVGLELTQEEAASAIGVDVRTYRRYESGAVNDPRAGFSVRHGSRRRLIDRMAAELGIDPRLLFEEDEPEPEGSNQSAAIATSAAPAAPGPHRLPPVPRFVGRTEILTRLAAWCRSGEPGVVALVGVGGAGKTSLAERLVSLHRADATVWSFYEDPRTEAMLDAALARIGSSAAAGARADQLERAMRERGGLLVLDGLEVAQADGRGTRARGELEDSALRRLLRAAAAGLGRAQVLITTRFVPVDLAPWEGRGFEPIALGDLPGAEAEELLERFGVEHGRSIAERFGGHALSLAVAGSYVRAFLGGDAHRLIEIDLLEASRDDPLARRLAAMVDAYSRALGPVERDALARLALFARGASAEVLAALAAAGGEVAGALAGADTSSIERALARLASLGLAHRDGRAYRLHPFVAQMARRGLGEVEASVHRLEASRLTDLLIDKPGEPPSDARALDRFEELFHHLLGAGRSIDALHLYHRGLGGFAHLGLAIGDMIRGARIASALGAAGGLPPPLAQEVAYDRGLYAGALGDLAVALSSYASYCAGARSLGDARGLTTGLRTRAYTLRLAGDLAAALDSIQEACQVAASLGDGGHVVRGLALRASIHHDRGDVEEADRDFALVRSHGDDPVARRGLWEAEHLVDLGHLDQARSLTERNLGFCEARGWIGHAAHCHALLGLIAARQGDDGAARRHIASIDAWTDRTGEVEMILRGHLVRGSLGEGREGRGAAEEAAARAGRLGFALFHVRFLRMAGHAEEADRRAAELGYAW